MCLMSVNVKYGKCSKILSTFLFLISNNIGYQYMADIHKMLVRIVNREDSNQTASSEAVGSGSVLFF